MTIALESYQVAGAAFDTIAARYDDLFTTSLVGRTQREVVWTRAAEVFFAGDHVLELNCGTGEDALFLARRGVRVTACDASEQMIEYATTRKEREAPSASIDFYQLPTERLDEVPKQQLFDGVFSNFSGLNCVADLSTAFHKLSTQLRPGAKLLLCLSTRFCLWELLHFAAKGDLRKAARRWQGMSSVNFSNHSFSVYYPTLRSLRRSFEPQFKLHSVAGVGIATPPSYLEKWISKHPRLLNAMKLFDDNVRDLPLFRTIGDHMLLSVEKV